MRSKSKEEKNQINNATHTHMWDVARYPYSTHITAHVEWFRVQQNPCKFSCSFRGRGRNFPARSLVYAKQPKSDKRFWVIDDPVLNSRLRPVVLLAHMGRPQQFKICIGKLNGKGSGMNCIWDSDKLLPWFWWWWERFLPLKNHGQGVLGDFWQWGVG